MSNGWEEYEEPGAEAPDAPSTRMIGGIPHALLYGPYGWYYAPIPMGTMPTGYEQTLERFTPTAATPLGRGLQTIMNTLGQQLQPYLQAPELSYAYPGAGGAVAGPPTSPMMQYDPFSQQLQAAQLQESIRQFQRQLQEQARQFNVSQGLQRAQFLQGALATPANVFSSFFLSRGQVPPYNAQLANILGLQGQGQPFFGALPALTEPALGQVPAVPAVPEPQPPEGIWGPPYPHSYARGGTYIPAEPAVAVGLYTGAPLFTFNEEAPKRKEKVKITPQKRVPGFQQGGNVYTAGIPGVTRNGRADEQEIPAYARGYNPSSGWTMTPGQAPTFGTVPPAAVNRAFSQYPAPLADVFSRGFPEFPFLQNLGVGKGLGYPQLGQALQGFPLPSPQALSRMTPSEGAALLDMFNTVFGVPGEDVLWASYLPFQGLRGAMPAMQRIG